MPRFVALQQLSRDGVLLPRLSPEGFRPWIERHVIPDGADRSRPAGGDTMVTATVPMPDCVTDNATTTLAASSPCRSAPTGATDLDWSLNGTLSSLSPVNPDVERLYFALLGIVGAIICLFGFVGNVLNIGVLSTTVRRSRTPTYHILLALAVSDAMIMIIYAAFALTFFARMPPIIRPEQLPSDASSAAFFLYGTWYLAINVFVCASNWYVVAVTFFRFLAVYFPLKVSIWCTLTRVRLVIVAVVALSTAVCVPDMLTIELYGDGATGGVRFRDTPLYSDPYFGRVYYTLQTVLLHLLPFVVNIVLVVVLIRTLFNSQRGLKQSINVRNARGREVDQRRVSVMLVVMVLFSLVTTLPSIIYRLLRDFAGVRDENEGQTTFITLRGVCDIVELVNYASNFYLYVVSNPSYRRLFLRAICCQPHAGHGSFTQYSLVNDEYGPSRQHSSALRSLVSVSNGRDRDSPGDESVLTASLLDGTLKKSRVVRWHE